ncbi:hypothetical protein V6N13_134891 [Hibiscus sabdariffa]
MKVCYARAARRVGPTTAPPLARPCKGVEFYGPFLFFLLSLHLHVFEFREDVGVEEGIGQAYPRPSILRKPNLLLSSVQPQHAHSLSGNLRSTSASFYALYGSKTWCCRVLLHSPKNVCN